MLRAALKDRTLPPKLKSRLNQLHQNGVIRTINYQQAQMIYMSLKSYLTTVAKARDIYVMVPGRPGKFANLESI